MKAEMDANGVITIEAENGIEAYALRKWMDSAEVRADDLQRMETYYWRQSKLAIIAKEELLP